MKIEEAATTSASTQPPKYAEKSPGIDVGTPYKPEELPKLKSLAPQSAATVVTPELVTAKHSGSKEAPKKAVTPPPPPHASKLETTAKAGRLFHRAHRVHHHAAKLVAAFDPYADVGEFQDGDEVMGGDDDGDDDYDSASVNSDNEDRDNQNRQSSDADKTNGGTTGAHMNLNARDNAVTVKATPASKPVKAIVSVQEIIKDKDSFIGSDPITREKEMRDVKDLEAAKAPPHQPRSLHRRSADRAKLIVWTLVIAFPLLFIGKSAVSLNLHGYNFAI